MAAHGTVIHEHAGWAGWGNGPWLRSKPWDLCCLTLSGVLVLIPIALYEVVGSSAVFVNLFVAGVIGGPHMYATFFRTTLDASFRQRYRFIVVSSCAIPLLVIVGTLWHFQLLITLFFFWASIHVLHQVAYIVECYERKQPSHWQRWSRWIDYALVFSCLFPMASYKFIHNEFYIGETLLLYPDILKTPIVFYTITAFFVLALLLFVGKTVDEMRHGTVHYPKLILILTTVGLALLITSYGADRLEIAFQGFNTWHSFQYLALTWYITRLRSQRNPDTTSMGPWLLAAAQSRFHNFYGANIVFTFLALIVIGAVLFLTDLGFERSYYIVVLSVLLVHYYHDHVLFTRFDDVLVRSEA